MQKHSEDLTLKKIAQIHVQTFRKKIRFAKTKRPGRDQRQDCFLNRISFKGGTAWTLEDYSHLWLLWGWK